MDLAKKLGDTIRGMRSERRLTASRFAAQIGKKPGVVSAWETGASVPDVSSLLLVADAFGVELSTIFQRAGIQPELSPPRVHGQTAPACPLPPGACPLHSSVGQEAPVLSPDLLRETWAMIGKAWNYQTEDPKVFERVRKLVHVVVDELPDVPPRRTRHRGTASRRGDTSAG